MLADRGEGIPAIDLNSSDTGRSGRAIRQGRWREADLSIVWQVSRWVIRLLTRPPNLLHQVIADRVTFGQYIPILGKAIILGQVGDA
jgi:hypothetical protein